jgi:hypothetical protein
MSYSSFSFQSLSNLLNRGHRIKVLVFFIIGIKPYLSDGPLIAQIDASERELELSTHRV